MFRALVLLPVWAWLLAFLAAPACILAVIALASPAEGVPPYTPGLGGTALAALEDPYYLDAFLASLRVGAISAVLCLLPGYPMALAIARAEPRRRSLLLLLVMLPFWTGLLLRLTAWIFLLRDEGLVNAALLRLGLIDAPLPLLHSDFAMYVGMVYCYLPFLILPLEARLAAADPALEQAAADLGAPPWRVFTAVTLPLSLPGVIAGLALVFVPVTGEYVIPELLGSPSSLTLGRVIWDEFFQNRDWPQAAALSLALLAALLLPHLADPARLVKRPLFLPACLIAGMAFLYVPIAVLVATSFNAARLTTVWTGFTWHWYAVLLQDRSLIDAGLLSLRIAAVSATAATALGGLAGVALARFGGFRTRAAFAGLLAAPLVLPDLLIGLALLLLFVAVEQVAGFPQGRGALTIVLAHVTISLAFVAVTVQARLAASGEALEQAAMDLGAPPWQAFLLVTLPLMAPSLVAGWLLAFTLSLDDLVVASFVSGPGASTLPMVVFSSLRLGVTPVLNALATVILVVVASVLLAAWRLVPVARAARRP